MVATESSLHSAAGHSKDENVNEEDRSTTMTPLSTNKNDANY